MTPNHTKAIHKYCVLCRPSGIGKCAGAWGTHIKMVHTRHSYGIWTLYNTRKMCQCLALVNQGLYMESLCSNYLCLWMQTQLKLELIMLHIRLYMDGCHCGLAHVDGSEFGDNFAHIWADEHNYDTVCVTLKIHICFEAVAALLSRNYVSWSSALHWVPDTRQACC